MVYVDMEMPKNCYECPMNRGEYTPKEIEKRSCYITGKSFCLSDYKKRPRNCPMKKIQKCAVSVDTVSQSLQGC